jgi:hypothetical protein
MTNEEAIIFTGIMALVVVVAYLTTRIKPYRAPLPKRDKRGRFIKRK